MKNVLMIFIILFSYSIFAEQIVCFDIDDYQQMYTIFPNEGIINVKNFNGAEVAYIDGLNKKIEYTGSFPVGRSLTLSNSDNETVFRMFYVDNRISNATVNLYGNRIQKLHGCFFAFK